ncbi:MAG: hypothetical protein AAF684_03595 [Pseudomonadota bacterium]
MAEETHNRAENILAWKLTGAILLALVAAVLGAIFIGLEVLLYVGLALTPLFIGYIVFMAATPDPGD